MKTVLLAAELGEGMGHVAPLTAIAERLTGGSPDDMPVRAIFAVRDPVGARAVFRSRRFAMLAAPGLRRYEHVLSQSSSYAELLTGFGFARRTDLTNAVAAWDDLFDLVQPDLLVADHSPIACLAARGRIPTLVTGNGYTVPPAHIPVFPALKAGMGPPTTQRAILDLVNSVLGDRGQSPLPALPALMSGDRRAIFTVGYLDPYGPLRRDRLLGPYEAGLAPAPFPAERRIFVYVGRSSPFLDVVCQSVSSSGLPVSAYLGGVETAAAHFLRSRGAEVFERPPVLSEILPRASLVVSHGGSGLSLAALAVGRPQIVVPIHAESQITAGRLDSLGVGVAVERDLKVALNTAIAQVAEVRHFRERASAIAAELAASDLPADPVGEAVGLCRELASL